MKKYLIIAAAVAVAASCTKSSVTYTEDAEISLKPVNYLATKAQVYGPYESTTYNTSEKFGVYAQYTTSAAQTAWNAITDGAGQAYLSNVTFAYKSNTEWAGDGVSYYWPRTGSLFFACYSPSTVTATCAFEEDNGSKFTMTDFTQGAYKYTNGTGTAPTDYKMVDLMFADIVGTSTSASSTTGLNAASAYPVTFYHSLSWLTFKFKCETSASDNVFTVKKVVLNQVNSQGDLTTGNNTASWANVDTPADITLFDADNDSFTTGANKLTNGATFDIDDILVIPQDIYVTNDATITITLSQKTNSGDDTVIELSPVSYKLVGGNGSDTNDDAKWLVNKHYTYTFTVSDAAEILITPSVDEWDTAINKKASDSAHIADRESLPYICAKSEQ